MCEREGERKREREPDKSQVFTLDQSYSTDQTMELRGVCVLLGVLLLVNCSLQQTPPKRKPAKKGRKHLVCQNFWQEEVKYASLSNRIF